MIDNQQNKGLNTPEFEGTQKLRSLAYSNLRGNKKERRGVPARAAMALADLVLSRHCRVCGARLAVGERHLCDDCADDIPFTYNWLMPRNDMADRFNALIQRDLEHEAAAREAAMGRPCEYPGAGYAWQIETNCIYGAEATGLWKHSETRSGEVRAESRHPDTENDGEEKLRGHAEAGNSGLEIKNIGTGTDGGAWGRREPYAWATALFYYRSGSGYRNLTRALKYHGDVAMGRWAAGLLAERLAGVTERWADVDLVVPVPLHWLRLWRRGYNQAAVIADVLAAALGAAHEPHLLRRVRRTRSQIRMGALDRKTNVSGAFRVNQRVAARVGQGFQMSASSGLQAADAIADVSKGSHSQSAGPRHILLVDDVYTTGSTLNECRKALRTVYGPEVRISIATLAFVG